MLYAQINPTAKTILSITPFISETIESDYMTVIATNYGAGATEATFMVVFGVILNNFFYKKDEISTKLANTDFEIWGKDDSILLQIMADKIGTTISSYITTIPATDLETWSTNITDLGYQLINN